MFKRSIIRSVFSALLLGMVMLGSAPDSARAQTTDTICLAYCMGQTVANCDGSDPEYCAGFFLGCLSSCGLPI